MLKMLAILTVLAGLMLSITGCNTVNGVGKDTERAGEKLQDAADRNR